MKVCFVTLHRVFNYGSILQAYATQKIVESCGFDCEVIDYITPQRTKRAIKKQYKAKGFKGYLHKFLRNFSLILKRKSFGSFIKKNLKLSSEQYIDINDLRKSPPQADIYMVGSDQVWNSYYNEGIDEGFFLNFGNEDIRRIAFVSSFGKEELDMSEKVRTKELLLKFNSISVREQSAQNIIMDLGLEKPEILIDPTLQISAEDWRSIASLRLLSKPYLLLMLLYNEDNGATDYAKKIAHEKGLILVKLSWDLVKDKRVDKLFTHRKPQDFLSLFDNASFVVTNSFHGLAFSINFNKQFVVVKRNQFNSRIDSLLSLTGLTDRLIEPLKNGDNDIANEIIDYTLVNNIIAKEREKARLYLLNALK